MRPKLPSASQTRFLTERLLLKDPERLLLDDPLGFLDAFVRGFRLHIPYHTFSLASILDKKGYDYLKSPSLAEREVLTGRGGSCGFNNLFTQRFLSSLGFHAFLIQGHFASRNFHREYAHVSVVARNVRKKNDMVFMDVGVWIPHMRAVEINVESVDHAVDTRKDIHLSYRFLSNASFNSVSPHSAPFSRLFDWSALFSKLQSEPALVSILENDAVISATSSQMAKVKHGELIPFCIFPSLSPIKDNDTSQVFPKEKLVSAFSLFSSSGFSGKSGDFVVYNRDGRIRCRGTNHDGVGDGVILESNVETEVRIPSTKDELVSLFHEDFPQLTDYFVDNLDILERAERRGGYDVERKKRGETPRTTSD